jgi:hypothetical protein
VHGIPGIACETGHGAGIANSRELPGVKNVAEESGRIFLQPSIANLLVGRDQGAA